MAGGLAAQLGRDPVGGDRAQQDAVAVVAGGPDEALVARLAKEQMTLTVCPLSNLKLCVVKDLKDHPIPNMLAKGLHVTLNSDDPSYFGGYVNDNYIQLAKAVGLTREQVIQMARNSFEGSFLPDDKKAQYLAEIDAYVAAN